MIQNSTKRIGLLVDSIEDLCESEICRGVLTYYSKLDVQVILFEGVHNFRRAGAQDQYINFFEMINSSDLDGLIIFSIFFMDHLSRSQLNNYIKMFKDIPLVSLGISTGNIPSVIINEEKGLIRLVDYLVTDLKLTNLCLMFGPEDNILSEKRLTAVIERLRYHKISIKEKNIMHLTGIDFDHAYRETDRLIKNSLILPEAIICYDDYIAHGVMDCLINARIPVPEEIIITGFDDISLNSTFHSRLITVKQPFITMGMEAAGILAHLIEQIPVRTETFIDPSLIICSEIRQLQTHSISRKNRDHTAGKGNTLEKLKGEVYRIIDSLSEEADSGSRILMDIFFSIDKEELCTNQRLLANHIKSYFSESHTDMKQLKEIRNLLKNCQNLSFDNEGETAQSFSLFSFALNSINDLLLSALTCSNFSTDELNWASTLGGQIMVRSDSLSELIGKLPGFLDVYNIKKCFLFLYKRDYIYLNSMKNELPRKTELIYVKSDNRDEQIPCPMSFNTMEVLPSWDILNYNSNYIFIMLFYNSLPVGHVFLDYDPDINPIQYGAIRINLETALYNIRQIEESQAALHDQSDYYISHFQRLKTPISLITSQFKVLKDSYRDNPELREMGLALYQLKNKMDGMFSIEEELHSFEFDQTISLSRWLEQKYSHIAAYIETEVCISFDSFALELIFRVIENNFKLKIDSLSLKKDPLPQLELNISGYSLSATDLEMLYSSNPSFLQLPSLENRVLSTYSAVKRILDRGKVPVTFKGDNDLQKTTVSIVFPRFSPNPVEIPESEKYSLSDSGRIEKYENTILLIEPQKYLRRNIAAVISRDFNVVDTSSVTELLDKEEAKQKYSLIISDLPDLSDTSGRLLEEYCTNQISKGIPVIFTSVRNSRKEKSRALKLGAYDYITKPLSLSELLQKIKNNLQITEIQRNRFLQKFKKTIAQVIEKDNPLTDIRTMLIGEYLKNNFGLSGREIEITVLIGEKLIHRQIAEKMNLTEQTIRNMSHGIYKKCQVSGKKELMELIHQYQL